jgi:outer membrane protein W
MMKKALVMMAMAALVCTHSFGQDFKKFKVGMGVGYGKPSEGSGGLLVYLEPMYRIQDQIAIGLRIESAAFLGQPISGTPYTTSAFGIGSYTLNGQYYFGNNTFRPFVGAGLGMFIIAAASADIAGTNVSLQAATSVFGFYPRIGFDLGHFNFSIDYNLIPEQSTQVNLGSFGISTTTSNYSYIGLHIGGTFGGGKK